MFSAIDKSGASVVSWLTVATPRVQGIACPLEARGAPERLDVAGVGRQLAVEDLQQRGLPRAVLAGEAVHLAGTNRYASAAEGVHTAEALVHARRAKNGLCLRPH